MIKATRTEEIKPDELTPDQKKIQELEQNQTIMQKALDDLILNGGGAV